MNTPLTSTRTGGKFEVTQPSLGRPSARWGHSKILVEVRLESDGTDDQIVERTGLRRYREPSDA